MISNARSKWKLVVFQGLITATLVSANMSTLSAATVLILDDTVVGGSSSLEAEAAMALGYSVEVVDAFGWLDKTQAEFASYRALILGDPMHADIGLALSAAEANRSVWAPVVNGNIIIVGTDPAHHASQGLPGAQKLLDKTVAFAVNQPNKTGLYVCLSQYYHSSFSTPVPVLDRFGSFTITGTFPPNCAQGSGYIVATHPVLTGAPDGLADADLFQWSCSVHEYFTTWPGTFQAFACTAPCGPPYILTRGEALPQPTVSIQATDNIAQEDESNPGNSPDKGRFLVSRTGSVDRALTVNLIINGTAIRSPSMDYLLSLGGTSQYVSSPITIPAGSASVAIDVWPWFDGYGDGGETVILHIGGCPSYSIGSPSSATVFIFEM